MNIDDLWISVRSSNALKDLGITTVEQLIDIDQETLAKLGPKTTTEIFHRCLDLLSGKLNAERAEHDKRWPPHPLNIHELLDKAKKYDEIVSFVLTDDKGKKKPKHD